MSNASERTALVAAAQRRGSSLAALSRLIGRNANYLQQWIARGSPRALSEADRQVLCDFLAIDEVALGGPARRTGWRVPRLDVSVSAGPGALADRAAALGAAAVPPELARALGLREGQASIVRARGDSMAPGIMDGDELLVDEVRRVPNRRGGIYVLRQDAMLLVKRVRAGANGLEVSSDNPQAMPVGDGPIEVIGRVVWQMRRPT